jgi:CheY-like chemotaxis protein
LVLRTRTRAEAVSVALVLIVDDEYFVRQVAISLVEEWGHIVLSADGVANAMLQLSSSAQIDALITDVRLNAAVQGGFELARQARRLRPNLPVLFVSGLPLTEATTALLVDGSRFLDKPYSPDQLQNAVQTLLAA